MSTIPLNIDCGRCGTGLEVQPDILGRALVYEDEEVTCPECGTINQMGVEEDESECEEEDMTGTAYVSHWTCKHGSDEDTPCPTCDAEDAAAPAPQGPIEGECLGDDGKHILGCIKCGKKGGD